MKMNFYVRRLPWMLALAMLLCGVATSQAQSAVDAMSFENFSAEQGWVFHANLDKASGLEDLDGCPSKEPGGAAFSAASFSEVTFNPQAFLIPQSEDASKPMNFRVGNQGVIQFHSAERLQVLYARYLKGLKVEKK